LPKRLAGPTFGVCREKRGKSSALGGKRDVSVGERQDKKGRGRRREERGGRERVGKAFTEFHSGTYDILVLPPAFPYGGMENPMLTFVTPALLR
jgi:hypothetical protein